MKSNAPLRIYKKHISFSFHLKFIGFVKETRITIWFATELSAIGERKLFNAWGICIRILFALNCFMKYDFVSQVRTKDWGKSFISLGIWKINWPYSIYTIFLHVLYSINRLNVYVVANEVHRSMFVMQCYATTSAIHDSHWTALISLKMFFEQYSVDSELAMNEAVTKYCIQKNGSKWNGVMKRKLETIKVMWWHSNHFIISSNNDECIC